MNIRKNVFIALTILLAPLLPYTHLLSLSKEPENWVWVEYKNLVHITSDFDLWIYGLCSYLFLFILFCIWRTNSQLYLKTSILSLIVWSFIMSILYFFDTSFELTVLIKVITLLAFIFYLVENEKDIIARNHSLSKKNSHSFYLIDSPDKQYMVFCS